jgi:serine/threonine protein kinase
MAVIVGAYELEGELGRGAVGRVYRARHRPTGAERAIKVLENASDVDAVLRFRREAAVLAQGAGDGVVTVHETGVHEGRLYFVMDLMRGGSLDGRLKARVRLPWREAVALVATLGRSLARYHERGLVHRDLKPANILFDEEDRPLLADFGFVRDPGEPALTESGIYVGTPSYSSPEQLGGERVGPTADVFSLGVVLYEAVAGELPHGGATLYAIANAARAGKRRRLAGIAGAPESLDLVLERALDPESVRRYPDGGALASALEALLANKAAGPPSRAGWLVALAVLALTLVLGASFLVGPHPGRADPPGGGPSGPSQPPRVVTPRSAPESEAARLALAKEVHELAERSRYDQADRACEAAIAAVGSGFAQALGAEVSLEAGDLEGALRLCGRALTANEHDARALAVLAEIALRRHSPLDAIALATSAIALGDASARARAARAIARSDMAQEALDEIIEDGERALALPGDVPPKLLAVLAKSYGFRKYVAGDPARASRDEKAAKRYQTAIEEARKRPLRPDEAFVAAAHDAWSRKDVEGTIKSATQAIELNPRRVEALCVRGHARARRSSARPELDAGIADLETAYTLDRTDIDVHRHLSEALVLRARARLAASEERAPTVLDAERAVSFDGDNWDALRVRATLRRESDPAGAIADLRRFIGLTPHPEDADEARREVEALERR